MWEYLGLSLLYLRKCTNQDMEDNAYLFAYFFLETSEQVYAQFGDLWGVRTK